MLKFLKYKGILFKIFNVILELWILLIVLSFVLFSDCIFILSLFIFVFL